MPRQSATYKIHLKGVRGGASRSILKAFSFDIYYGKRRILKDQAFGRLRSKKSKEKFVKQIVDVIERKRIKELNRKKRLRQLEEKLKKQKEKLRREKAKRRQAEMAFSRQVSKIKAQERTESYKEAYQLGKKPMMKLREDLFVPYGNKPSVDDYKKLLNKKDYKELKLLGDKVKPKRKMGDEAYIEYSKKLLNLVHPKNLSKERLERQKKFYQMEYIDMPDFNSVYATEVNEFEKRAKRKMALIVPFKPKNDIWEKDYIYKFLSTESGKIPICIYSMTLEPRFHIPVSSQNFYIAFSEYIDRLGIYIKAFFDDQQGKFNRWFFRLKFVRPISENQYIEQGIAISRREAKNWNEFKLIVIATFLKLGGSDRSINPTENYLFGENEILLSGFTLEAT